MPRVYLAGPDVFLDRPKAHGEALKKVCAEHGLEGVFPFDADVAGDETMPPAVKARRIFEACLADIRGCQGVLANMRPFRGPSTDVGTAWEMGYAHGLGLPIVGYTMDGRSYPERVEAGRETGRLAEGVSRLLKMTNVTEFLDPMTVENFGLHDNLMLDCSAIEVVGDLRQAAERMARLLGK